VRRDPRRGGRAGRVGVLQRHRAERARQRRGRFRGRVGGRRRVCGQERARGAGVFVLMQC
jgi:hypothetical protein